MKIAVYPGSFDPVTNGHLDIIERSRRFCDKLIVAIAQSPSKNGLFSIEERLDLLKQAVQDLENVTVTHFSILLADFVREQKASAVIRGLRAVSDFDYEYAMYQMNAEMCPEVETIFLLASKQYSFLSSSILKELARFGRNVENYTPIVAGKALLQKLNKTSNEVEKV